VVILTETAFLMYQYGSIKPSLLFGPEGTRAHVEIRFGARSSLQSTYQSTQVGARNSQPRIAGLVGMMSFCGIICKTYVITPSFVLRLRSLRRAPPGVAATAARTPHQ